MSAGKPIVSTPITDVAEPYGDIVYLGATPEEFIKQLANGPWRPAAEERKRAGGGCAKCWRHLLGTKPRAAWTN